MSAYTTLTFVRAEQVQNSAGEMVTSFVSFARLTGELQPDAGGYPRHIHGTVTAVDFDFYVLAPDPGLEVGDRAYVRSQQVEAVRVNRWDGHLEIALKEL